MKNLFTPGSLLMYLLTLPVFFAVGMSISAVTGAAKGQGLAGGAIVFIYGVITAGIALIFALLFCYYADLKKIKIANRILAVLTVILLVLFTIRFFTMKDTGNTSFISSDRATTIAVSDPVGSNNTKLDPDTPMGLGFFKPDFFKSSTLYFYGEPNFEKPVQDHSPTDSLAFKDLQENSDFDLLYAPPWLFPEHNKLDYGIFYFRLQSVGRDFAGVTLNSISLIEGYVDRNAGEIIYWPDFLLKVHSVEFLPGSDQKVRFKALDYSAEINIPFDFMSPAEIREEWMRVQLYNSDYQQVGTGWIQWKKEDRLLISYSLLS